MKCLGMDLGTKTLGLATSDKLGIISSPYKVLRYEDINELVDQVVALIDELKIDTLVLGYPKNMNNSVGEKGQLSQLFKEKLEKIVNIPIYLQDERLTTKTATDMLIEGNVSRKNRKKVVDAVAATIILQSFLDKKGKE